MSTTTAKQYHSKTLNKFLSIARLNDYQLPGDVNDVHLIGVSGGADSSVLAMLMATLFPDRHFTYVFTDTQEEAAGTQESLARLEAFTGSTIIRSSDQHGLYGLIEKFSTKKEEKGYFLPNGLTRFCTRILKVEQFENFMETVFNEHGQNITVHNYAGIRYDEPARSGFDPSMPFMQSHFPMRDLGMVRADVFNILEETIGIPAFYRYRSRSGCSVCPFMRSNEMLGTLMHSPEDFQKAMSYETLTPEDEARYQVYGFNMAGTKINYPIPATIDARTADDFVLNAPDKKTQFKRSDDTVVDLLTDLMVDVYVGVEYLVDTDMALYGGSRTGTPGTYHMELVGWSTTKAGISRKLSTHYYTREDTCEVFQLDEASFKQQYKMAVFHLEMPSHMIDLGKSSKGTYSWRKDEPMAQIVQAANFIKRTMMKQALKLEMDEYKPFARQLGTWEAEQYQGIKERLANWTLETGEVLGGYRHHPAATRPQARTPEEAPCLACSK